MHHTIEVENLIFKYPDGTRALDGVSLHIAPSEKVALVGPNGAGKSTLILHLNGILSGEGVVRVASLDVIKKILRASAQQWVSFSKTPTINYFRRRCLMISRYAVFLENRINCGHEKSPVT